MRPHRTRTGRLALAATSVAALVATTLATAHAAPSAPAPDTLSAAAAGALADSLTAGLGGDAAGAYYDAAAKKLVVNVVDRDAAAEVRRAGAEARLVEHSQAELTAVQDRLTDRAVPGTARAVDPRTNKVVVTADSTVKGTALKRLQRDVAAQNGTAVLERTPGTLRPLIRGGDAIYSGSGRCSLGFNVVKDGQPYFLTAGHCASLAGSTWSETRGGPVIARVESYRFPGSDDALVKYTANVAHPSEVNLYNGSSQPITAARDAVVGERVRRSGSTTQVHDGTVRRLHASVTYPQGTVNDLIQTNVCAEPGDSGGSLFAGTSALGLTSGGSGNCRSGGTTYFQPVTTSLAHYRAQIG